MTNRTDRHTRQPSLSEMLALDFSPLRSEGELARTALEGKSATRASSHTKGTASGIEGSRSLFERRQAGGDSALRAFTAEARCIVERYLGELKALAAA